MIDTQHPDAGRPKKTYSEPKLVTIPLRPEEAVLGHCKTSAAAGPGNSKCSSPSSCHSLGS
jgi:hypothetical protein